MGFGFQAVTRGSGVNQEGSVQIRSIYLGPNLDVGTPWGMEYIHKL